MKITYLIPAAVVLGALIGVGSTIAELGLRPAGDDRLHYGGQDLSPLPKTVNPPGVYPKAVLVDGERDYDFGRAQKDMPLEHDFTLRNDGPGVLSLVAGQSSCTCTVAKIEKDELKPGESTKITVKWHGAALGPFRQNATIKTNDPDDSEIALVVAGEIVSTYRVEPERLTIGGIIAGDVAGATTRVLAYGTEDLQVKAKLTGDPSTARYFELTTEKMPTAELSKYPGAKSGVTVHLTTKPALPAGPFAQTIHLELNLPERPEIDVPVDGKVNGPIEVAGANWNAEASVATLGQMASREGAKTTLFLMVRGTPADQVKLKIESREPDDLHATLGPVEKLSASVARAPLTIEIPPGTRPQSHLGGELGHLGRITINTGLESPTELRILVRYAVEKN